MALTNNMAFLGISMHLFQKKVLPACQDAVTDVCAKPVPVWGKRGEMRVLLWEKTGGGKLF